MTTPLLFLAVRQPFDFRAAACDHGWVTLAPVCWIEQTQELQRTERLVNGRVVFIRVTAADGAAALVGVTPERLEVRVESNLPLTPAEESELLAKTAWMLRVHEDFSEFYQLCRGHPHLAARVGRGGGRLLRSPTLWEDVVKAICTTNITWSQAEALMERLVDRLGTPFPLDPRRHAFPTPEQVHAAGDEVWKNDLRFGYREDYIRPLAEAVVTGTLDLEALKTSTLPTEELRQKFRRIKGVGDYAAATLVALLGRYDELAVDSELRRFVSQKYFSGNPVSHRECKKVYESWDKWKYLAYWYDAPAPGRRGH